MNMKRKEIFRRKKMKYSRNDYGPEGPKLNGPINWIRPIYKLVGTNYDSVISIFRRYSIMYC